MIKIHDKHGLPSFAAPPCINTVLTTAAQYQNKNKCVPITTKSSLSNFFSSPSFLPRISRRISERRRNLGKCRHEPCQPLWQLGPVSHHTTLTALFPAFQNTSELLFLSGLFVSG